MGTGVAVISGATVGVGSLTPDSVFVLLLPPPDEPPQALRKMDKRSVINV